MTGRNETGRYHRARPAVLAVVLLLVATSAGAVTHTSGSRPAFRPLGEPGPGGPLTSISVQPGSTRPGSDRSGTLLVGGRTAGTHVSGDLGATWTAATGLLSFEMTDSTWDPRRPEQVWAGSLSGPALSTDAGRSFTPARTGMAPLSDYPYSAPVQRLLFVGPDAGELLAFGGDQHRRAETLGQSANYGAVHVARRPDHDTDPAAWQWELRSTLAGNVVAAAYGQPVAGYPQGLIWAVVGDGDTAGVYLSTDTARSFTRVADPGGDAFALADLAVHPTDPTTVWVARRARSDAGGATVAGAVLRGVLLDGTVRWVDVSPPRQRNGGAAAASSFAQLEASATLPPGAATPVLYASDTGAWTRATYLSDDSGATWTAILDRVTLVGLALPGGGDGGLGTLAVDPADPYHVLAGNDLHLLGGRSSPCATSGWCTTWRDLATTTVADGSRRGRGLSALSATGVWFDPYVPGALALSARDGGSLWQRPDADGPWARPLAGLTAREPGDRWLDETIGVVAVTHAPAPDGGSVLFVLKGQPGGFAGIARSVDSGATFTLLERDRNGLPPGWSDSRPGDIEAFSASEVVVTLDGCLWRTRDGGHSWQHEQQTCMLRLGALAPHPFVPTGLFAQGEAGVYLSLDGGRTFSPVAPGNGPTPGASPGNGTLTVAAGDGPDDLRLYATTADGARRGLFRWTREGWVQQGAGLGAAVAAHVAAVAVAPQDPDLLALVIADAPDHDRTVAPGVAVSRDGGNSWTVLDEGLGVRRAVAVAWDPFVHGHLVVGTLGGGFVQTFLG